ncbi:Bug family tripartite tricarboxylate transporter substrate binding protein [Candidimonas nitroreducens]|uniref:ABC transporter substrate-binding protein n=1 Tax=Candidimonas nitroreducens TaxID=683354 RepID=A0A225MKN3_9BURK|nr:tripartite tricarboxylate transporter substrate binding protein [Candidimonas nitroreducens]OWT61886.1 hypothetical protein CEY11_08640 [Candidimonas nitroreducens]
MNAKRINRLNRRRIVFGAATYAGLMLCPGFASAQGKYPNRPVKLVIPWSAGGSTDVIGRVLAESMGRDLGVSVVVENKPGATGTIGYANVARAEPDGYTLLMGTNSTFAMAPHYYKGLSYDIDTDFTPLGMIASNPQILCVNSSMHIKSVREFVDYLKKHPGKVAYASAGYGGSSHLAMEMFLAMTGTEMLHVPYKGGGPALQSLMANDTQAAFVDLSIGDAAFKSGVIRPLGTSGTRPSAAMPQVPPIADQGVPGFESLTSFGLFGPKGLAKPVAERVNKALRAAMKDPFVQKRLASFGFELVDPDPSLYAAYALAEREKWGRVISQRGITFNK